MSAVAWFQSMPNFGARCTAASRTSSAGSSAAGRCDVLPADMDAGQGSAGNVPNQFAGHPHGVVPNTSAVDGDHHPIDVANVEVITHQHRTGGQLKHVLASAVGENGPVVPVLANPPIRSAELPATFRTVCLGSPSRTTCSPVRIQGHPFDRAIQELFSVAAVIIRLGFALFLNDMQELTLARPKLGMSCSIRTISSTCPVPESAISRFRNTQSAVGGAHGPDPE